MSVNLKATDRLVKIDWATLNYTPDEIEHIHIDRSTSLTDNIRNVSIDATENTVIITLPELNTTKHCKIFILLVDIGSDNTCVIDAGASTFDGPVKKKFNLSRASQRINLQHLMGTWYTI